jgi:hypothetical protein
MNKYLHDVGLAQIVHVFVAKSADHDISVGEAVSGVQEGAVQRWDFTVFDDLELVPRLNKFKVSFCLVRKYLQSRCVFIL